jgi:hypothetical protein
LHTRIGYSAGRETSSETGGSVCSMFCGDSAGKGFSGKNRFPIIVDPTADKLERTKDIKYTVVKEAICSSCVFTQMFHLVKDNLPQIENNLLWVKSVRDSIFSWWFNVVILVSVLGSFAFFLYYSYGTATPPELQKVKFEARTWNNAVRNVPTTEYGQTPAIETGDTIQGFTNRTSATAF